MTRENAEYKALERVVTADKRYRRFVYVLSFVFFVLVIWGGYNVQQNIENKIDVLVNGAVTRAQARDKEQRTIAKESIKYTTCIFVVPIEQRTSETQQKCFELADLPGGLTRSDFSPIVIPKPVASTTTTSTPVQSSLIFLSSPSSNNTANCPAAQSNNSQQKFIDCKK